MSNAGKIAELDRQSFRARANVLANRLNRRQEETDQHTAGRKHDEKLDKRKAGHFAKFVHINCSFLLTKFPRIFFRSVINAVVGDGNYHRERGFFLCGFATLREH